MQRGNPFTLKAARLIAILLGCFLALVATEVCATDSSTMETPATAESKIAWEKDLQQALARAQREGRPVLLDFYSPL